MVARIKVGVGEGGGLEVLQFFRQASNEFRMDIGFSLKEQGKADHLRSPGDEYDRDRQAHEKLDKAESALVQIRLRHPFESRRRASPAGDSDLGGKRRLRGAWRCPALTMGL